MFIRKIRIVGSRRKTDKTRSTASGKCLGDYREGICIWGRCEVLELAVGWCVVEGIDEVGGTRKGAEVRCMELGEYENERDECVVRRTPC